MDIGTKNYSSSLKILMKKHSAIVIDEELIDSSFLELKYEADKVLIINNFDDGFFFNINM